MTLQNWRLARHFHVPRATLIPSVACQMGSLAPPGAMVCPPTHTHTARVIPPGSCPTCSIQLSLTVVDAVVCHRDYPSCPHPALCSFRTEVFVPPATGMLASVSLQPHPSQETTCNWRKTSGPRSAPSRGPMSNFQSTELSDNKCV